MSSSITQCIVGLDLGQAADPSALAVLEQTRPAAGIVREATYGVRELRRWPLGTAYPAIVNEVVRLAATPPLLDCQLVIDGTGCGRAVVDLFRLSGIRSSVRPVLITAGHAVSTGEDGYTHIAKVQLVSTMMALMGTRRIRFAKTLPLAKTVETELQNFKVKINIASATESFEAWREGQHDDLAFAVMLAAFIAERGSASSRRSSRCGRPALPSRAGGAAAGSVTGGIRRAKLTRAAHNRGAGRGQEGGAMKYALEIWWSDSGSERAMCIEADTPFQAVQPGDLINPRCWKDQRSELYYKILVAARVEHFLGYNQGQHVHKVRVFAVVKTDCEELRSADCALLIRSPLTRRVKAC